MNGSADIMHTFTVGELARRTAVIASLSSDPRRHASEVERDPAAYAVAMTARRSTAPAPTRGFLDGLYRPKLALRRDLCPPKALGMTGGLVLCFCAR
jgi:hypothetical protein